LPLLEWGKAVECLARRLVVGSENPSKEIMFKFRKCEGGFGFRRILSTSLWIGECRSGETVDLSLKLTEESFDVRTRLWYAAKTALVVDTVERQRTDQIGALGQLIGIVEVDPAHETLARPGKI
jgi:hypothetical protein